MRGSGPVDTPQYPVELTSFIGRHRELAEITRQMSRSRLLTLLGAGGTGKTRLAGRVSAGLRRTFADGVFFVDLTELRRAGPLAPPTGTGAPAGSVAEASDGMSADVLAEFLASALRLHVPAGEESARALVDRLADRRVLLVMDNCEHLLPASAIVADALLRGCPNLKILATSRESLGVEGEALFSVSPLPTPGPASRPDLGDLAACESVTLFIARGQAAEPTFALTEQNAIPVAEICRRLEGLPLAIELAAARLRVLAPQQILDRLGDRFALLSRGSRTAPERQRTLRACVAWSFDLCSERERILWARLSVFSGGFDLDAAEGVCADHRLPSDEVFDLLASLVDKSVVVFDNAATQARYRMLETLREQGEQSLSEAAERQALRRRHRDWYRRLMSRAHAEWGGRQHAHWVSRVRRDHANVRAAVDYSLTELGDAETALSMLVCLPVHYWWSHGLLAECRRWLARCLAQAGESTVLRARALLLASDLAFVHGDTEGGAKFLESASTLARHLDASAELANVQYTRGISALVRNDLDTSVACFERGCALLDDCTESSLDLRLRFLIAHSVAAGMAGDHDSAYARCEELLAIIERVESDFYRPTALWATGVVSWLRVDHDQAAAYAKESLRLRRADGAGPDFTTANCLELLAWITADQHQHDRAARLLGAVDALRADTGGTITVYQHLAQHHSECERKVRRALGHSAFSAAYHDGAQLTYEDAVAFALAERRRERAEPATSPSPQDLVALTRRERQVAELVARGASNREIAHVLVISQRTAEGHVENILTKLGFRSRARIAAWMAAQCGGSGDARTATT